MNKIYQNSRFLPKKAGFTLIELLVVVLIIGILAAVAFPKYQLAVDRAKYHAIMDMVDSLVQAQERYYLANGEYALSFEDLDIQLPSTYTPYSTYCITNKRDKKLLCTTAEYTYGEPWGTATVQYYRTHQNCKEPGVRVCNVNENSSQQARWKRLCASMGEKVNKSYYAGQPAWKLY